MRCPFCRTDDDRVVDSRVRQQGNIIRRRRECRACGRRYTTLERVERTPMRVIKKDGSRVPFDRQRILQGLVKACYKRPPSREQLEELVDGVEAAIAERLDADVPSAAIGDLVMARLRELDKVAYVRFASVYRRFEDVSDFVDEVRHLDQPPEEGT